MFAMLTQRAATPTTFEPLPVACPKCGTTVNHRSEEAQRRIQDLEDQVQVLHSKAAAAVDRITDYEEEVRSLKAQCAQLQSLQQQSLPPRQATPTSQTPELTESPLQISTTQTSPPRTASRLANLSSFFSSRVKDTSSTISTPTGLHPPPSVLSNAAYVQSTPNLAAATIAAQHLTPPPSAQSANQDVHWQTLQSSLEDERTRRLQAETSLNQTQTELEELTAQLFGQANEMVAAERKARHKLEERVKVLENRDGEKRKRLERLEKALQRIERVRGLVERRNTVHVVDASGLPVSESEDESKPPSGSTKYDSDRPRTKASDPSAKERPKDRDRDRDRQKIERKGTV